MDEHKSKKVKDIESFEVKDIESFEMDYYFHRKDFILTLYYLQFTHRFRENPAYKRETFETYINDKFHLRIGTYEQERWAFIKHERASLKYGPGFVIKIKNKCGVGNVKRVLAEIDKAEGKRKTPLPRDKKEAIIFAYALLKKMKQSIDTEEMEKWVKQCLN